MNLFRKELAILELLTWKVRVATARQLSSFQDGIDNRLHRLIAVGLIRSAALAVKLVDVNEPLCRWVPGNSTPNFEALSYRLLSRRERAESTRESIFWAGPRAVQLVGGVGGRLRQPLQVEHDLGVAQVCLTRICTEDEAGVRWLGEDCHRKLHRPSGKVPDAVLCDADGRIHRAIEYGGLYTAKRLRGFHQHCARRRLPYEIW